MHKKSIFLLISAVRRIKAHGEKIFEEPFERYNAGN